jgi:Xaa-Pro aminopeptidase
MGRALKSIQKALAEENIDFYWVPASDEYLNEYVVERAKRLKYLSGFSGSAGNIIIGQSQAWLFVDGRYHVQAPQEVDESLFQIEKLGVPGVHDFGDFLLTKARGQHSIRVGVDPDVVNQVQYQSIREGLQQLGSELTSLEGHLVDRFWDAQPEPRVAAIEALTAEVTGTSFHDRQGAVRDLLVSEQCDGTIVQRLDQIAWFLGMRGQDIDFNPVFESLLLVTMSTVELFVHPRQRVFFSELEGVEVHELGEQKEKIRGRLKSSLANRTWYLDPHRLTQGLFQLFDQEKIVFGVDLIEQVKACKNSSEIACMSRAGLLASAAKIRALHWLDESLANGEVINEKSFKEYLESCYGSFPEYRGLSFEMISSVGPNSAICHYGTPNETATFDDGLFFLIDSGAHYVGGTTDATRTVYIGSEPSQEHIRCYTLVLKAHAACARQRFPQGTTGVQLDAITRAPLWCAGEDYIHGTGHGVGSWLNVHEGPMGIGLPGRGASSATALEAGQVLSIEPGLYKEGWGGVRIENLYQVRSGGQDQLGRETLSFDPLTWIPLDPRLIDGSMLTFEERDWLNFYQRQVLERLCTAEESNGPQDLLNESQKAWLSKLCEPL